MLSQVQWWENEGQRALANNSVAFKGKPDMGTFMREWTALYESKSGERGIFNRRQLKLKQVRMVDVRLTTSLDVILVVKSYLDLISSVTLLKLLHVRLIA
jgi:hypothetical protein